MQPSTHVEAVATDGIDPPAAFDRLRSELHAAAGCDRITNSRTRDTVTQLRTRADFFRDALHVYAGTGLGDWYAELSTRLHRLADEIETDAHASGILGGAA
ncbi:hypothetical protein [Chromohalobacter moromii]|uniref:Uncharacterized protein n=1 Tax=Chromohalobacter moromii TaxID=2860329 RepID=A0A9X3B4Q4_9GAMM|nr:hypothetical protein [Chromohalobacter moromii]MCK2046988.1 hypothetical protein [Chromohalobacter moromii]MCT8506565.1 hypothetical protein [Chromohalobacter moromii]